MALLNLALAAVLWLSSRSLPSPELEHMAGFHNPVDVRFGCGRFAELPGLLAGRPFALVTYGEPLFRELARILTAAAASLSW